MGFHPLPVGIDDFAKIINGKYYYVDKTWLIKELLDKKSEVNLFTRPRRFGKTLNMSMLQYFFEDTGDEEKNRNNRKLFSGLKIMSAGELYTDCIGKYPIINLSLKASKQTSFSSAYYKICEEIGREFDRHAYVISSLSGIKKENYLSVLNQNASQDFYSGSLKFLSGILQEYHHQPVIILIDEYDVPLENAYYCGFYKEMSGFIRSLFESALKTNPNLEFAVVTGCLRISRESIFTGLNNFNVISILSSQYDEYFGFEQHEVDVLLEHYRLQGTGEIVKKWYDGYLFGTTYVYNPWSVINYVSEVSSGGADFPRPYWSNTSANSIVQDLIKRADVSVKSEIEKLMSGGILEKPVHEDITYDTVYDSEDNLWNFLFFTGYLKLVALRMEGRTLFASMAIPNEEVAYIYDNTIRNWFRNELKTYDLTPMYQSMLSGDAGIFQKELAVLLQKSISYMDNQEAFYQGFLLGIFNNLKDYLVESNRESGDGRPDIVIRSLDVLKTPVILELKISKTFKEMEKSCKEAILQIDEKNYVNALAEEGYTDVWKYGVAFFRKQCLIHVAYEVL